MHSRLKHGLPPHSDQQRGVLPTHRHTMFAGTSPVPATDTSRIRSAAPRNPSFHPHRKSRAPSRQTVLPDARQPSERYMYGSHSVQTSDDRKSTQPGYVGLPARPRADIHSIFKYHLPRCHYMKETRISEMETRFSSARCCKRKKTLPFVWKEVL